MKAKFLVLAVLVVLAALSGACTPQEPDLIEVGMEANEKMGAMAPRVCEDGFRSILLKGEGMLEYCSGLINTGVCKTSDQAWISKWEKALKQADLPTNMTLEEWRSR